MAVNKKYIEPGRGDRQSEAPGNRRINLISFAPVRSFLCSRWYPGIFQWPTLIVFALVIYALLYGPASAHENFGTSMTWVIWWPAIPLLFLLLGRFWCAVCPFATLNDVAQKWVGVNRPVPQFLKKYGIWIIDAIFVLITWADHIFGIVSSPAGSGILLMMIITGVIASGAFFQRRTWCRHLCFLGGLSGNYSRAGAFELRATPEICAKCKSQFCYKGNGTVPGCPMFEFPRVMDTSAECNLCANCVKSCPNDSIRLSPRVPTSELWTVKKPRLEVSVLAMVIMGIVFVQNVTMLDVWGKAQAWIESVLGMSSYSVTFSITFIVAMAIPVLALLLAGWAAGKSNGESASMNFTRFGYSLIPLDLGGHLAHNLFHLLAEGKSAFYTFLTLFGVEVGNYSAAVAGNDTIHFLQLALVGLGTLGSLYAAWRIARGAYPDKPVLPSLAPYAVLIVALAAINVYLFSLPMSMRM